MAERTNYVEETSPGVFSIQEASTFEMELIHEALINFVGKLPNVEPFKRERNICQQLALKIDLELIKSKS